MEHNQQIKNYCHQFKITGVSTNIDQLVIAAQQQNKSYLDFIISLFEAETHHRQQNEFKRRLKAAQLPLNSNLDAYNHGVENGLSRTQFNQLRDLAWVDQIYNLMLMGPSGTGKTFLAAGLCADATARGFKAYFRTMEEIINMLKLKDVTRTAMNEHRRLAKANLIVIDDIMLFPMEKNLAVSFFNFVNQVYENTSFIITTNKMPADWAKTLDDEVLATALLDRLLFRCEVVNLSGKSYRINNRKTIFESAN
ncbi:IS21-like element helper ATPase IstB [Chryseolinea sp. H1M3-3]|uniref:IS21-like element helper ATPase IstB n=1 Tax=Chryseolinea sp. H1M3-3 TaxID=3034144 RepID=UPI0023ECD69A|nr:IS21-like element helper ATPase IstB [Chryseolinea sp. H1M3-3]